MLGTAQCSSYRTMTPAVFRLPPLRPWFNDASLCQGQCIIIVIYVILQQWIFLSHRPKDSNVQLTPMSQRFRLYTAQFQTVFSTFGSLWGHREGMSAIWLSQAQNSAWCFWWAANHNQKSLLETLQRNLATIKMSWSPFSAPHNYQELNKTLGLVGGSVFERLQ